MADALEPAVQILAVLSSAAGVLGLAFEILRHGRTKEHSFRPAVGLTAALVGVLVCASAIWFLVSRQLEPLSGSGRLWTIAGAIGVLLLAGGLTLALLVPTTDRRALNRIARVVDQVVQQCDLRDGFTIDQYVDLGVRRDPGARRRPRTLTLAQVTESGVTLLTGPAGAGKTTTLRALVRISCLRSQASRRPDTVVLYVNLADMAEITTPVTADTVRAHLLSSFDNDVHLKSTVAALLERADPHLRLVFVIDLGTAMQVEQAQDYVAEVSRLVRRHRRNHALIAARTGFEAVDVTFEPAPARHRRRELLLRRRGMTRTAYRELLNRLDLDPELDDVAHLPATLAMIARHRDALAEVATPSHEEFIERLVQACLDETGHSGTLRPVAEEIAYRLTTGEPVTADDRTRSLAASALGTIERNTFRFHADVIQAHLAAGHLIRIHDRLDPMVVLGSPILFAALTTAMRRATPVFSTWLIDAARAVVTHDSALDNPPDNDVPGTFRWNLPTLRTLEVLRWGLPRTGDSAADVLPSDVDTAVDALVRRGVLAGGMAQQRTAVSLLPLANAETARTAVDRLVVHGGDSATTRLVVEQLPESRGLFAHLPVSARLAVFLYLFIYGFLPATTARSASMAPDKELTAAVTDLARVMRITAFGNMVFSLAIAIREPNRLIVAIGITLASVAFLVFSTSSDRSRSRFGRVAAIAFLLATGVVTLNGVTSLAHAVAEIMSFDFAVGFTSAVTAWLLTWPLAAVGYIAATGGAKGRLWVPQAGLVQLAWADGLPAVRNTMATRSRVVTRWLWPRRVAAGLICAMIVAFLAVGAPVPANAKETTNGILALVAIAAFVVFASRRQWGNSGAWRRLRWDHRQLSRLDADAVFSELTRSLRAGRAATNRFLTAIGESKSGRLHAAAAMLVDLDNLMQFLAATLPDDLKTPIKEGFWLLVPAFHHAELRQWIIEFDQQHPGMLINFANTERDRELLTSAALTAQGPGPVSSG
ncbi:ATP-binding protein [Amycolatopsis sp. H6(2020)]|nr:ATP-binding protein [Amycolatopsis sp. H6(2020)]